MLKAGAAFVYSVMASQKNYSVRIHSVQWINGRVNGIKYLVIGRAQRKRIKRIPECRQRRDHHLQ